MEKTIYIEILAAMMDTLRGKDTKKQLENYYEKLDSGRAKDLVDLFLGLVKTPITAPHDYDCIRGGMFSMMGQFAEYIGDEITSEYL